MSRRALVVCPGRGSYDRATLGSLAGRSPAANRVLDACDAWRAAHGRPGVRELDAEPAFKAGRHVAGEHASLLTFACSLADLAELDRGAFEVVGVTGNSMGWYTALGAVGALPLEEAVRLVDTMGAYQEGNVLGGQVLYPLTDDAWRPDPAREAAVEAVLAGIRADGAYAGWSIRLGGHAVLGGDAAGVKLLMERLPPIVTEVRTFPLQLPMHSAFHTPVLEPTSARARVELGDLAVRPPDVALIDGRGGIHRPRWADPAALLDYTLGHQVVQPYDLTTAVRTALRHTGADVVIALGPGNSLGGPLARILVQEGWGGPRDKAAFEARQASDRPLLLSFGVAAQRAVLTGSA